MEDVLDKFFTPVFENECQFMDEVRFLDTEKTKQEREVISQYFEEQISKYSIKTEYIQNQYSLKKHNSIYGEHTTKKFAGKKFLNIFVIFNSDTTVLNQFGLETDGDITAFIHIQTFFDNFGYGTEPLAGDLIKLVEYGETNRPNFRGPAIFEITRRDDEDLEQINPLIGHYVWLIRAKRYDYSFERNVEPEPRMNQVNDDVPIGTDMDDDSVQSEHIVRQNTEKTYEGSADESGKEIFDYDEHKKSKPNVYGEY